MAAIATVYAEETTEQTHTGDTDWTDVLTAASAGFVANGVYLLICIAQIGGSNANGLFHFQLIHGGTTFTGAEFIIEPTGSAATYKHSYGYMTKYTAPDPVEDVKFQFKPAVDTDTVRADSIVILAIRLDADLVDGTDYEFGEDDDSGAPTTHTDTHADFANITFTPGNDGDDWLVIACSCHLVNSSGNNSEYRIRQDGNEGAPADDAPMWSEEGEDLAEQKCNILMRVYNLDNAEHTFAIQGRDDAATFNSEHYYSAIIAVRLDVFEDHAFNWNEAEFANEAETWEELVGLAAYTPSTVGDNILMGFAAADAVILGAVRIQVGGATIPTGKDLNYDSYYRDPTDENPMLCLAKVNMDGEQDIDYDSYGAVAAAIEDRSVVVFSLELAAAAPVTRRIFIIA